MLESLDILNQSGTRDVVVYFEPASDSAEGSIQIQDSSDGSSIVE